MGRASRVIEHPDSLKAKASREGDAYHEVWAARRCLRLLDGKSRLRAVTIEGATKKPTTLAAAEGFLKVDMAEYFGGRSFEDASRIAYIQLKYSPLRSQLSLQTSELADTFGAFAKIYQDLAKCHSVVKVTAKVEFKFVTNRPVSTILLKAIRALQEGEKAAGAVAKAANYLAQKTSLAAADLRRFTGMLQVLAGQSDRGTQRFELQAEIDEYVAASDALAWDRVCSLVRERAGLSLDAPIERLDVLKALDISSEERLLPSPASTNFSLPTQYVPRSQEDDIRRTILNAKAPVIVQATAGIGKSVMALRLPALMPDHSESVVFDGFADGLYRQPERPRYRHDHGLVQIANELAIRGLCRELLPSSNAPPSAYLRAFLSRIGEAAGVVRARDPDAVLLVVIDAADNVEMGAEISADGTHSFARDLLHVDVPPGCRIVSFSRPERIDEKLRPPEKVQRINLAPFSLAETKALVSACFKTAKEQDVVEFQSVTFGNPRVQSHLIQRGGTLTEILQRVATGATVNQIISDELENALGNLRQEYSPNSITNLCLALAALPPLVPISVLARAARVPEGQVRSFITGLSHALIEIENQVHFRDEPVDTWFQNQFAGNAAQYSSLVDALTSEQNDLYVAHALPSLLWHAGRLSDLTDLALSDASALVSDPVERRRLVFHRTTFALNAALVARRDLDAAKLAMRAGEEAASDSRLADLLFKNADLVSKMSGAKRGQEVVFGRTSANWLGSESAYCAAILAGDPGSHGEAQSMIRRAEEWLSHWSKQTWEERQQHPVVDEERCALLLAHLRVNGPVQMVRELERWRNPRIHFSTAKLVGERLSDHGEYALLEAVGEAALKNPFIGIAVVHSIHSDGRVITPRSVKRIFDVTSKSRKARESKPHSFEVDDFSVAKVSLAECAVIAGVGKSRISGYLKSLPVTDADKAVLHYSSPGGRERGRILRIYALQAVLSGKATIPIDVLASDKMRENLNRPNAENNPEVKDFKDRLAVLVPWYILRARCLVGEMDRAALKKSMLELSRLSYGYEHKRTETDSEVAEIWIESLVYAHAVTAPNLQTLLGWMRSGGRRIFAQTWLRITRIVARAKRPLGETYQFATEARTIYEELDRSAESTASDLVTLCRAVLPIDKEGAEARAYFNAAQNAVSGFGNEAGDRWAAVIELARAGSDVSAPDNELAYAFCRAAEILEYHVGEGFDWGDAVASLANLSVNSAFAIASRWRDRRKCAVDSHLDNLLLFAVETKVISPRIAAALTRMSEYLELGPLFEAMLKNSKDNVERDGVLNEYKRRLALAGNWDGARKAKAVTEKLGLADELLALMSMEAEPEVHDYTDYPKVPRDPDPKVDWKVVVGKRTFTSPGEIDAADAEIKKLRPFWPFNELLRRMRKAVPRGSEKDHLVAFSRSRMSRWDFVSAIRKAKEDWRSKASVQASVPEVVAGYLRERHFHIFSSRWELDRTLADLADISSKPIRVLSDVLIAGAIGNVESLSSEQFFWLASQVAKRLTSRDARFALAFSLDRVEVGNKAISEVRQIADGEWRPELEPPSQISLCVAGFLYGMLASPDAHERWRVAHSVMAICDSGDQDILHGLWSLLDAESLPAFSGANLPFYFLHARLYFLIAVARASIDAPGVMLPYTARLATLAKRTNSHILIRHFAAAALLHIWKDDVAHATGREQLEAINRPAIPARQRVKGEPSGWSHAELGSDRLYFPYELDKSSIGPLSSAFGIPFRDVATRMEEIILDVWGVRVNDRHIDEPRKGQWMFSDRSYSLWSGNSPRIHTYSHYLSYHALLHTAGEFLETIPTVEGGYAGGWKGWWTEYALTRPDGRWLADARSPVPLGGRNWRGASYAGEPNELWPTAVLGPDFDRALYAELDAGWLRIGGNWQVSDGTRREEVGISSALVSEEGSDALLRALQTAEDFNDFVLPLEGRDQEIRSHGFRMNGWRQDYSMSDGIDGDDPFAVGVNWPGLKPGKNIRRLFEISPRDPDERSWISAGHEVLSSNQWMDRADENERKSSLNKGDKLCARVEWLGEVLSKLRRCLIISVRIHHGYDRRTEEFGSRYSHVYERFYLLHKDGRLTNLSGTKRLWKGDRKRDWCREEQ